MAKAKTSSALVNYDAQMAEEAKAMQGRITRPTGSRIQLGKDKSFRLPDGRSDKGPIGLVILDFINRNMFYEGAYDERNPAPPTCFAIHRVLDEMKPSPNAPEPQSKDCVSCPNNVFGSGGGRRKACKNTRLLAVLAPDADEESPIMLLTVGPSSIKNFDTYVSALVQNLNKVPVGVITHVAFDPGVDYQMLRFGNPEPNKNMAMYMSRREEARAILEAEPDYKRAEAPVAAVRGRKR